MHTSDFGGPLGGRSIVKTVLAFAYKNGVNVAQCEEALAYLRDEAARPCFGYYYETDLVSGRPSGVPIHVTAVSGRPGARLLLAYLEYFGLHRVVICLSRSYGGPAFDHAYGLDPLTGAEIQVRVKLEFSQNEIDEIDDYKKVPARARHGARQGVGRGRSQAPAHPAHVRHRGGGMEGAQRRRLAGRPRQRGQRRIPHAHRGAQTLR
jgi:hypothetical protein